MVAAVGADDLERVGVAASIRPITIRTGLAPQPRVKTVTGLARGRDRPGRPCRGRGPRALRGALAGWAAVPVLVTTSMAVLLPGCRVSSPRLPGAGAVPISFLSAATFRASISPGKDSVMRT